MRVTRRTLALDEALFVPPEILCSHSAFVVWHTSRAFTSFTSQPADPAFNLATFFHLLSLVFAYDSDLSPEIGEYLTP